MKKFKGFSGVKIYDGERYVFKKGVAVVPNMRIGRMPVKITMKEFNEYSKETT